MQALLTRGQPHKSQNFVDMTRIVRRAPMSEQGRWLKSVRALNGLKQEDLALLLGMERSSVANMETDRQPFTVDHLTVIQKSGLILPELPGKFSTFPPNLKKVDVDSTIKEGTPVLLLGDSVPSINWKLPTETSPTRKVDAKFTGPDRFLTHMENADLMSIGVEPDDLLVWHEKGPKGVPGSLLLATLPDGRTIPAQLHLEGSLYSLAYNGSEVPLTPEITVVAVCFGLMRGLDGDGEEMTRYSPRCLKFTVFVKKD